MRQVAAILSRYLPINWQRGRLSVKGPRAVVAYNFHIVSAMLPPVSEEVSVRIYQTNRQFVFLTAAVIATAFMTLQPARADENGVQSVTQFPCTDNAVSSIVSVCKKVKDFIPAVVCPTTSATCVRARQEIFTGVTGEAATPVNIKPWNGQGGGGEVFQTVGLCLMRDLAQTPMTSKATASLPIGSISAEGLIGYSSFDPNALSFKGYHRLIAHAPVIGDIDIMTQPFGARAVSSNVTGLNKKVGGYAIYNSHALEFEAEGGAESFDFKLDAIKIVTPYGTVSPQPHMAFARASFWSLSPYGGASKMLLNPGAIQTTDVYGRLPGQAVASSLEVTEFKMGKYPGAEFCENYGPGTGCIWPKPTGWDSQLMLGSRNVALNAPVWTAPPGVEFPPRPDANTEAARGAVEKVPGGFASAGVKVNYSPVDMIPAVIRNSSFISITFNVFADPNIAVSFASQFNFWNGQAGAWNPALTPPQPPNAPVIATPVDVESLQTMGLYGGSSVAGRFAIDSGVDLVLKMHIPLPWPLDDIKFTIINVHPRAPFLEDIDNDNDRSAQQALVISDWQHLLQTSQVFKMFTLLNGAPVDGVAYLQKCLADPPPPPQEPEEPDYTPGDPNDLVEILDMPCNICVGQPEFTYVDFKTQIPPTFQSKVMKGHAEKIPYVDDSAFAPADRWTCGGALPLTVGSVAIASMNPDDVKTVDDANKFNKASAAKAMNAFKNVGCYDQCRVNKTTGAFELVASAKQLFAQGKIKDAPNGCY